jgi:hypothetical protein
MLEEEVKASFDILQIEFSSLKGKMLSQSETLNELIKSYNEQKVKA